MIVATVMFVTTTLLTLVMYYVWVLPYAFPLLFVIVFGGIDLAFWACTSGSPSFLTIATIRKFLHGAWVPCCIGIAMTCFMSLWRARRHISRVWDLCWTAFGIPIAVGSHATGEVPNPV